MKHVLPNRFDAAVLAAVLVFTLAGCASESAAPPAESAPDAAAAPADAQVFKTADYEIRVTTLTKELSYPYSFTFLPDGTMLIAQLNGQLRVFRNGALASETISGIPQVHYIPGRGGLLDITLHPKFAENRWVYFTYDKPGEKGSASPAVARGTLNGNQLTDVTDILVADAWAVADGHLGAYIRFTPDGMLYMSTGDREEPMRSQKMSDDAGKILRIRDDGSVPNDNPFVGREGHSPRIFNYGHRDVHAMTVHPTTGDLWTAEHGDEVNIERAGVNYGWPHISVNGRDNVPAPAGIKLSPPYLAWNPPINVSGMSFYMGDVFSKWKGNLLIGGLAGRQVQRIAFAKNPPDTNPPASQETREPLFDIGTRVRDVKEGPDGLIYFVTDEEVARLFKVEPVQ